MKNLDMNEPGSSTAMIFRYTGKVILSKRRLHLIEE